MDPEETTVYTAVLISAVVLGTIILFFIVSIIRQQRRNIKLLKQSMLAEINTMERERTRIAADLHDELGPVLSTIKFKIDSVQVKDRDDAEQLNHASRQVDGLVGRLRQIAANLMPSALLRKGLVEAIEEFSQSIEEGSPLRINFSHKDLSPLSQEMSINIYRMIQEITNNTMKHAQATRLSIDLSGKDGTLTVKCIDNGKGFDYEKALVNQKGFGLGNLKSRTEVMEGTFHMESKMGVGTSYLIKIPIKK